MMTVFFSIPVQGDWILFDSGASASRCPINYATEYPLLPVGENVPKLKSATGEPLEIHGRRVIHYNRNRVKLFINYYVCNVPFCIVSVAPLLLQGFWPMLGSDCSFLLTPNHECIDIGTLLYITPERIPYCTEHDASVQAYKG